MHKLATLLSALFMLSACQGQPPPQIRFGDIGAANERRELASEVTKTLIRDRFGYQIIVVPIDETQALKGIIAGDFDVTLFVRSAAVAGVSSTCSGENQSVANLGPVDASDRASKVVRCDLAHKDANVFEMLKALRLSATGLDEALAWKHQNSANAAETAKYYLEHNSGN